MPMPMRTAGIRASSRTNRHARKLMRKPVRMGPTASPMLPPVPCIATANPRLSG